MKVIFASLSTLLLSSVPGVLSAEPSLRGAALVTDFDEQAINFRRSSSSVSTSDMPRRVARAARRARRSAETRSEGRRAERSIIRSWQRNTQRRCISLDDDDCESARRCEIASSGACVSNRTFLDEYFFDSEDYDYDFDEVSDNSVDFVARSSSDVKKAIKKAKKKNPDITKKEISKIKKKVQKKVDAAEAKRAAKACSSLTKSACDLNKRCEWDASSTKCGVPSFLDEELFDSEDYDYDYDYDFAEKIPSKIKKKIKQMKADGDKKGAKKLLKKYEKKVDAAEAKKAARTLSKTCSSLTKSACDLNKRCEWDVKKTTCGVPSFLDEDFFYSEDYDYDFAEQMPSKIKKKIKSLKKEGDKKGAKKLERKWESNTEKNCADLEEDECDDSKKCLWTKKSTCVSRKVFEDFEEDYYYDEDSEDYYY